MKELKEKVRGALRGTSNRSEPGPDGISYRFIMALNTKLGRELITEVAMSLKEGRIPEEWQHSKLVFTPKPNQDHRAAKGWRPINLINCIGKLAEKVDAGADEGAAGFILCSVNCLFFHSPPSSCAEFLTPDYLRRIPTVW